jgi:hypothetical protein
MLSIKQTLFCKEQPNGVRYWACGRDADSLDGQKNFGTLTILEKPYRTHKSSARQVSANLTSRTRRHKHNRRAANQTSRHYCIKI